MARTSNSQDGQSSPTDFLPHLHAVFDPDFSSNEALAICLKSFGKDVPCCRFHWIHLSIFSRILQVWCSRDFWWPCTDSQHGFHQQSCVQGTSIALLALHPLWAFWADFVLKIRQGLFGGAICGRDASSHRLDYYKELPTRLFYAHEQKKVLSIFKQKSVWDKKTYNKKHLWPTLLQSSRSVFFFWKFDSWTSSPWRLQDIHGFFHVDEAGGRSPSFFFSNVDSFYLNHQWVEGLMWQDTQQSLYRTRLICPVVGGLQQIGRCLSWLGS